MRRESDQALLDAFETDREANERLKQLERVRSEMASTVSHELRTPLTSAAGYVELLAEGDAGPLTAEQRDMLDTVARSLSRLDGIVDDVLGMASPGQHGPVDPGSADLEAVLQSAVDAVALQAMTRGQDLNRHERARRRDRRSQCVAHRARHRQPADERGEVHARGRHDHRHRPAHRR